MVNRVLCFVSMETGTWSQRSVWIRKWEALWNSECPTNGVSMPLEMLHSMSRVPHYEGIWNKCFLRSLLVLAFVTSMKSVSTVELAVSGKAMSRGSLQVSLSWEIEKVVFTFRTLPWRFNESWKVLQMPFGPLTIPSGSPTPALCPPFLLPLESHLRIKTSVSPSEYCKNSFRKRIERKKI